jgi:hypothetical protein
MPTKTTKSKTVASRAKPAAQRAPKITRYIAVTGDLAAAMKDFQKHLAIIGAGKKVDVKAFDRTLKAMNKAGEVFDALTDKYEEAVLEYVDRQAAA